MENLNKSEVIVLCRQSVKCCPTVQRVADEIVITDDYNGTVKMHVDELKILLDRANELVKD